MKFSRKVIFKCNCGQGTPYFLPRVLIGTVAVAHQVIWNTSGGDLSSPEELVQLCGHPGARVGNYLRLAAQFFSLILVPVNFL